MSTTSTAHESDSGPKLTVLPKSMVRRDINFDKGWCGLREQFLNKLNNFTDFSDIRVLGGSLRANLKIPLT